MDEEVNGYHETGNQEPMSSASSEPSQSKVETSPIVGEDEESATGAVGTSCADNGERRSVDGESASSSVGHKQGHSTESSDKGDSRKKFRIVGLKQSGDWRSNEKLWDLFTRSEQFHIWFDSSKQKGGVKVGGASLTFDTIESARNAFQDAHKINIDGQSIKLQASRSFYEPSRVLSKHFSPTTDDSLRSRTVYALNLIKSADRNLLKNIFGEETISNIFFLPQTNDRNQAEVILNSIDDVATVFKDADGFELDDGDEKSVLKLLTPADYTEWVKKVSKPQPFTLPSSQSSALPAPASISSRQLPAASLSEAPAEEEIIAAFDDYVNGINLNWAEIKEKEEMYSICDKISESFGGLPDSYLKPGLLSHLEAFLNSGKAESAWMRRHLEDLIKIWKGEMKREVLFERSTRIPLQAPQLKAVPTSTHRRKSTKSKANLKALMGIGSVLGAARAKFGTEEGELDIDEDEAGNYSIGGETLSFDSWAKLTKAHAIPRVIVAPEEAKKRPATKEDNGEKGAKIDNRKMKRAKIEEEKKKDDQSKELEEGEMESEDDGKESSSDDSSSQSSSESEGSQAGVDWSQTGADSRRRRRNRRKHDRRQPATFPPFFKSLYEKRVLIISALKLEHKKAFGDILSQITSQKAGFSNTQQKDMFNYMRQEFDKA